MDDYSDDCSSKEDAMSNSSSRPNTPQPRCGKKTRGRVKIQMEFIQNKLRRYTTFSKRKSGIMKKAHELATLTGTQVMLLVASETGHVYTFATKKLQPMLVTDTGKQLIQTCLNSPDQTETSSNTSTHNLDEQRMSAQGFQEPDLLYNVPSSEAAKVCTENVIESSPVLTEEIQLKHDDYIQSYSPTKIPSLHQSGSLPINLVRRADGANSNIVVDAMKQPSPSSTSTMFHPSIIPITSRLSMNPSSHLVINADSCPHTQGNVLSICGDDDRRGQVQLEPQHPKLQHSNNNNNLNTAPVTTSSASATGEDDDDGGAGTPIEIATYQALVPSSANPHHYHHHNTSEHNNSRSISPSDLAPQRKRLKR